ncbi:MAG: hypothetical protein RMJ51_03255 [Candidatus Calescibacterium sp.]|nr:hypothetical protein [Candidatus Calescibacterium sp.]MCX7972834.1 hypothetical protein [bacterium]MDW8195244.1 hypothetical protein [Candidatus Calescibacterium sp.]
MNNETTMILLIAAGISIFGITIFFILNNFLNNLNSKIDRILTTTDEINQTLRKLQEIIEATKPIIYNFQEVSNNLKRISSNIQEITADVNFITKKGRNSVEAIQRLTTHGFEKLMDTFRKFVKSKDKEG